MDRRRRDDGMTRHFRVAAQAAIPTGAPVVTPPPPAGSWTGTVHTPRPTEDLVDYWGVMVHFVYSSYISKGLDTISGLIRDAGIRWVRDSFARASSRTQMRTLMETYGFKVLNIMSPQDGSYAKSTPQLFHDRIRDELGVQNVVGIEGWNEPGGFTGYTAGSTLAQQVTQWQTWIWEVFRQESTVTTGLPIIGPSLADSNSATKWGAINLTAVADASNIHDYPGGSYEMTDAQFTKWINNGNLMVNTNHRWTTETGMTTGTVNGGYVGTDQEGQALAIARVQWEHFRRGWDMSSTYEMVSQNNDPTDFESNFGLLNFDLTPRPAYMVVKNTLTMLADPGASYTPTPLAMNITGDANTRYVVLSKRDGSYWLAVWQQVQIWNATTRTVSPTVTVPTALTFDRSRTVRVYDPYPSTTVLMSTTTGGTASIPSTQRTLLVHIV
jgi:hypothetical protein